MGVRLSDKEVWEFLAKSHTGILATLRRDGAPAAVPIWFVTLDGAVHLRTLAGSAKAGHLRRDPRVCFLVESGRAWRELKAVAIHGLASFVEDAEERARVDALFDAKYAAYRTPPDVPAATRRHYAAPRAHIAVRPTRGVLTWDNARLRG